jgi:hypothetical protein
MAEVARRPGMFTGRVSYEYMVRFLTGYDIGQRRAGGRGLEGFGEWLQERAGRSSPLGWPHLALLVAFPDRDLYSEGSLEGDEAAAVAGLFAVIDAFLAERDQ